MFGITGRCEFTTMSNAIKQSISLTDSEAETVNNATDVWTETWQLSNQTAIKDESGNVTGYQALVLTKDTKGNTIDTGVQVFSQAKKDKEGNTSSTGVWTSKAYEKEASKIEKKSN